jgi:DNA recombination protein RmuC
MEYAIVFIIGVVIGAAVALAVSLARARAGRDAFAAVSQEVLAESGKQIVALAEQVLKSHAGQAAAQLDGKKELIDQSLTGVTERLEALRGLLQRVETERQRQYGELNTSLSGLSEATASLRNALAGSRRTGEWGERMTADVLAAVGMVEGVNYVQQSAEAAESGKPDFTFLLPGDRRVNMDVKLPMETGLAYLECQDEVARRNRGREFVSAVRGHVRAVGSAKRGYIDPASGTLDYAIMFVPNEQLYALALGLEPKLMDEALTHRVVLCGPLTLYALLAVIRQSAENANVTRTAAEVIELLGAFEKQWQRFRESMDAVGKRIDDSKKAYDDLVGRRTRMLERPLAKIEDLRSSQELSEEG